MEESLQDCIIENGKYLNIGGTCIEECFEGQTLIIYDWSEGYCCCKYKEPETTTIVPSSVSASVEVSSQGSEETAITTAETAIDSKNTKDSTLDCKVVENSDGEVNVRSLQRIDTKVINQAFPNFIQNLIAQNNAEFTDTIKDCEVDGESGKYLNVAGSCIGNCGNGKISFVYDENEGFCCCKDEKTEFAADNNEPIPTSNALSGLLFLNAGDVYQESEKMQDCMVNSNGHFLNDAGSCAGECSKGKRQIMYDENEGFCCCAFWK